MWTVKMCERQNTIVRDFGLRNPPISAYEISDWIYAQVCLKDKGATIVQIDGPKGHVNVNFKDNGRKRDLFHSNGI